MLLSPVISSLGHQDRLASITCLNVDRVIPSTVAGYPLMLDCLTWVSYAV
jgi:hypothetical protein